VDNDAIDFITLPGGKSYSDISRVMFDIQPGKNNMGDCHIIAVFIVSKIPKSCRYLLVDRGVRD